MAHCKKAFNQRTDECFFKKLMKLFIFLCRKVDMYAHLCYNEVLIQEGGGITSLYLQIRVAPIAARCMQMHKEKHSTEQNLAIVSNAVSNNNTFIFNLSFGSNKPPKKPHRLLEFCIFAVVAIVIIVIPYLAWKFNVIELTRFIHFFGSIAGAKWLGAFLKSLFDS